MSRLRFLLGLGTAVLLLVLGGGGFVLLSFPPAAALRADVQERLAGELPERKVQSYVRALAGGDENAALALWVVPPGQAPALAERRVQITHMLARAGVRDELSVEHTEWWRTCCEPGVIENSREAGGARMRVRLLDRDGLTLAYSFDLFTAGGAYSGGALGYPPRQWVIRDVYPLDQVPLYWRFPLGP